MTLNLLTEVFSEGYYIYFVFVISVVSIISGISTIVVKNPVFSVLFLIGLFIIISIYLNLIGLTFMGLSYLLIYVGAVSILFLFILMLLNIRVSELITEGKNSLLLAAIIVLYLSFSISLIMPYSVYVFNLLPFYSEDYSYFSFMTYIKSYYHNVYDMLFKVSSLKMVGNVNYLG